MAAVPDEPAVVYTMRESDNREDKRDRHREAQRRYVERIGIDERRRQVRESLRRRRAEDPERFREYRRRYDDANRDKIREQQRSWREANRDRSRDAYLRATYGITFEQYQRLLDAQEGRCGICRSSEPGGTGTWHVDHDHQTNAVRGLLCQTCNMGLGALGDTPDALRRALAYLSRQLVEGA